MFRKGKPIMRTIGHFAVCSRECNLYDYLIPSARAETIDAAIGKLDQLLDADKSHNEGPNPRHLAKVQPGRFISKARLRYFRKQDLKHGNWLRWQKHIRNLADQPRTEGYVLEDVDLPRDLISRRETLTGYQ